MSEFIFNTSFYVGKTSVVLWKQWLKNEFLPCVEKVLLGISHEIFEIISVKDHDDNRIFSLQWRCYKLEEIELLDQTIAPLLQILSSTFGEEVTYYSSIMEKKI